MKKKKVRSQSKSQLFQCWGRVNVGARDNVEVGVNWDFDRKWCRSIHMSALRANSCNKNVWSNNTPLKIEEKDSNKKGGFTHTEFHLLEKCAQIDTDNTDNTHI